MVFVYVFNILNLEKTWIKREFIKNSELTLLELFLSFITVLHNQFIKIIVCKQTGGFLLLQNFSVAISVSPHVCFILVLILISMFLR